VGPFSLADSLRNPLVGVRPPHELHLSDLVEPSTGKMLLHEWLVG